MVRSHRLLSLVLIAIAIGVGLWFLDYGLFVCLFVWGVNKGSPNTMIDEETT
jgi:uncharacterized membrane protein